MALSARHSRCPLGLLDGGVVCVWDPSMLLYEQSVSKDDGGVSSFNLSAFCGDYFGDPSKRVFHAETLSTAKQNPMLFYNDKIASGMLLDLKTLIKDKFTEIYPKAQTHEPGSDNWEVLPDKDECDAEDWEILPEEPKKIIDRDGGKSLLLKLDCTNGNVLGLSFNNQVENLLACGGYGEKTNLYHIDCLMKTDQITDDVGSKEFQSQITSLEWHPLYPTIFATASDAPTAKIWDIRLNNKKVIYSCNQENMECTQVCWNPNVATQFAVASIGVRGSASVKIWDIRKAFQPLCEFCDEQGVISISWCPNLNAVLSTTVAGGVDFWKLNEIKDHDPDWVHYHAPDHTNLLPGGMREAIWCNDTVLVSCSGKVGLYKMSS